MNFIKSLFKSKAQVLTHSKVLNKDGFVSTLKEAGYDDSAIEVEWNKVVTTFSLYFFQNAYDMLDSAKKTEVMDGINFNEETGEGLDVFMRKMTALFESNPKIVNQEELFAKTVKMTEDKYIQFLEAKDKESHDGR